MGELVNNVWRRKPELTPLELRKHKTIDRIYFELGSGPDGQVDVREVIYPPSWPDKKIREAIASREKKFEDDGCQVCNALNFKKKLGLETPTKPRFRIFPGKRPIRDSILKILPKSSGP